MSKRFMIVGTVSEVYEHEDEPIAVEMLFPDGTKNRISVGYLISMALPPAEGQKTPAEENMGMVGHKIRLTAEVIW